MFSLTSKDKEASHLQADHVTQGKMRDMLMAARSSQVLGN